MEESERTMICSFCLGVPSQMCLACASYLCAESNECNAKHAESCSEPELHPAELVELFRQGEEGIARLRRGQTVDRAVSHLRSMLEGIKQRALADIEAVVLAAHDCIDRAKEGLMAKVSEEVLKLSRTIDDVESRLGPIKYSEAPEATLEVESLFLTQSIQAIVARLEEEQWIEVARNSDTLSRLQSDLASVLLSSSLLRESSACPWANRYALLLGDSTKMCDLATLEMYDPPFSAAWGNVVSAIQLPSGAYFLCGGRRGSCYLVDHNYAEIREAGRVPLERLAPGLAERGDNVYVFGGLECNNEQPTRTIQLFDLHVGRGRTLGVEMVLERYSLWPCWCRGRILLAGGMCAEGIEEFDPVQESVRFIPAIIVQGPSVCFPHGEGQIVILSGYQFLFDVNSEKLTTFSYNEHVFLSLFKPLLFQGKYYFTVFQNDTTQYKLVSMCEESLELQFTSIEYKR